MCIPTIDNKHINKKVIIGETVHYICIVDQYKLTLSPYKEGYIYSVMNTSINKLVTNAKILFKLVNTIIPEYSKVLKQTHHKGHYYLSFE